jgi:iron complex outermembrane receptor protein
MERAPEWVFTARLQYTHPMPTGDKVKLADDSYYTSKFAWEAWKQIQQPAYSIVNARASWVSRDVSWDLSFWGKNLANKNYTIAGFITLFGSLDQWGAPRTFGVSVTKRF